MDKWENYLDLEKLKKFTEKDYKKYMEGDFTPLKDGEPCNHKGCLKHFSHPCEECGRIGASDKLTEEYYEKFIY